MTAQLLTSELNNLIQESKRKNNDLRQAAERSLEELKGIRASSESQLAAELAQRIHFANPFIVACGTKNAKFTAIAIVCLQRLVVARALPRSRLSQVLEALQQATSAGLDVQLKILQALPSLLSNYAADVEGELLVTALTICFVLQSSKNAIVNNTAAATLQQLVVTVFDKVVSEDKSASDAPTVGEVPTPDGPVALRTSALDAYRIFHDLCLLTEGQRPEYLRFAGLSQTFGLELIESVLTNHAAVFSTHPEQAAVLRARVMPFLVASLRAPFPFATGVRLFRILYTLLRRHLALLRDESGDALDLLTSLLDQDTALWRRALCMEVFRGLFAEPGLLRRLFLLYDAREGARDVLRNLTATFVRVSTEKPSVIGLGHQSTLPVANPYAGAGASSAAADAAVLEASGVGGIISGSVAAEGHHTGISTRWSLMRVPCIDQLDKTEPPAIPESYVYSLTLACITSLSEGLAKFILPLTVPGEGRSRKRGKPDAGRQDASRQDALRDASSTAATTSSTTTTTTASTTAPTTTEDGPDSSTPRAPLERSASFKKNPVPVNPLSLQAHPLHAEVRACADFIEQCWPAVLATCSTFLYAALDSEYYHGLVRAFQKFAHVAGLLQLATPRDAFLTTLGKAAVPPHVFTACLNAGSSRTLVGATTPTAALVETPTTTGAATPTTSTTTAATATTNSNTSSSIFGNARGLLSVDSLVSPGPSSQTPERPRPHSAADAGGPSALNTRNLLCLRALLNLGIALGPTLGASWQIVLETLQQADFVLFASGKTAGRVPPASRAPDAQAEQEAAVLLSSFGGEIRAVETAASRLLESTVDFPNAAFVEVLVAVCNLLEKHGETTTASTEPSGSGSSPPSPGSPSPSLKTPAVAHRRVLSISTSGASGPTHEDQFALAKLGDLATINLERLLTYPPAVSGWAVLVSELVDTAASPFNPAPVRLRAAETLVRFVTEAFAAVAAAAGARAAASAASRSKEKKEKEEEEDEEEEKGGRGAIQVRLLEALHDALRPLLQREDRRVTTVTSQAADVDVHRVVLEGLKGILESCGESLVGGWERVFRIVDSIFVERQSPEERRGGSVQERRELGGPSATALATRSTKLIRPSFASLQLVCSDFLPSLPNACFLRLVDSLYKFCTQDDDLNVALTTVTFFWAISDYLSGQSKSTSLSEAMLEGAGDEALARLAADADHPGSGAALWMLLLLRLTNVATDERLELRNSAVQTLMRIISAYGEALTPEAWLITVRSVVFRLLSSVEAELRDVARSPGRSREGREPRDLRELAGWKDTGIVVVQGVSALFAAYLGVLTAHPSFAAVWQDLLDRHFAALLDCGILDVSAAVFAGVRDILSRLHEWQREKPGALVITRETVDLAWHLWARGVPVPPPPVVEQEAAPTEDNQTCLLVWVEAFLELYRLVEPDLDAARVRRLLALFRDAMLRATAGGYVSDVDGTTPLQARILEALRVVRTDIPGVPAALIAQTAEFVSLAFAPHMSQVSSSFLLSSSSASSSSPPPPSPPAAAQKRTFVAMSRESMAILRDQIVANAADPDIYRTGALAAALSALAQPIVLKYGFPVVTRARQQQQQQQQPWREATSLLLDILDATLPHIRTVPMEPAVFREIWDVVVTAANGILLSGASCDRTPPPPGCSDVAEDQDFDIAAFRRLRQLIVPALGGESVPEETRRRFAEGLFRASLLHAPAPAEAAAIYGEDQGGDSRNNNGGGGRSSNNTEAVRLGALNKLRRGRTVDPPPTRRSKMSYVCLDELFALVSLHDEDTAGPSILVQPPTPRRPAHPMTHGPPGNTNSSTTTTTAAATNAATTAGAIHEQHVRLARTAAPFLLLRCALTLRAYAADQPLRGRMPQPASQRRELLRVLDGLVALRSDPAAIPEAAKVDCEERKHLLRLYPLLVSTAVVAGQCGDDKVLGAARGALDAVGGELGI